MPCSRHLGSRHGWPLAASVLLGLLLSSAPAPAQVILSEIMFDPSGSEFYDEFIEIQNTSDSAVDLFGWRIGDADETDELTPMGDSAVLEAGDFALVLDSGYPSHSNRYDPLPEGLLLLTVDDAAFGSGGLSNSSPEPVILISADGDTIAQRTYSTGNRSGQSDEKIDPLGGDAAGNWAEAKWDGGTPGRLNSVSLKEVDLAVSVPVEGRHLAPTSGPSSLPIQVRNAGRFRSPEFDLHVTGEGYSAQIRTRPGLQPGQTDRIALELRARPAGLVQLAVSVSATGDQDHTNDSDTVTVVYGSRPGDVKVSEVMFVPADSGTEWVEVLNTSEATVNTALWRILDARGGAGGLISEPGFDLPPMGYAILADDPVAFNTAHPSVTCPVAAPDRWPTLNDGGDSVVLVDGAGTVIDSSAYPGPKVRRPGRSVERISLAVAGHAPNSWLASTHADRSTAGRENSVSNRHVTEGVELTADPNPFRERTEIRIGLPVDRAHVHLWVYDRAGRKVASLLHGEEGGSRRKVAWGGTGVGGAPLKPGIYILFLEASAPDGRALRARSTVVVARGL